MKSTKKPSVWAMADGGSPILYLKGKSLLRECKGKYKKHYWPDDQMSAVATSKTKKNM